MMGKRRIQPETNAGSMADIAFLILIFFLVVTSIETNVGINRRLPSNVPTPIIEIQEKNLLRIVLNNQDQLMVENKVVGLEELYGLAVDFLDNGGIEKGTAGHCDYCRGQRNTTSSDNPEKAVISFTSDRAAKYATYVAVQNQLSAAYNHLRNREAQIHYNRDYTQMEQDYYAPETSANDKVVLSEKITSIRSKFPLKISEAKTIQK